MDQQERFERVVEGFSAIKFGDEFLAGANGFVDSCYDAGFSLIDVPFLELQDHLQAFDPRWLLDISQRLFEYLETIEPSAHPDSGLQEANILRSLEEESFPIRECLAALAIFMYATTKIRTNSPTAVTGVLASAVYINLVTATKGKIPASLHGNLGSSTLFNSPLYRYAMECLDRTDSTQSVSSKSTSKKKAKKGVQLTTEEEEVELISDTNGISWSVAHRTLLTAVVFYLRNLDLKREVPFHRGRIARIAQNIWNRCCPTEDLRSGFNRGDSSFRSDNPATPYLLSKLFSFLLAERQQTTALDLTTLFWALQPGLIGLSDQLTAYPAITVPVRNFSKNITAFCGQLIAKMIGIEECDAVIMDFIMDIFSNVPDTSVYRKAGADTLLTLLDCPQISADMRSKIIQNIALEAEGERVRSRAFALAIAEALWDRPYLDVYVPFYSCKSKKGVIMELCCRRMLDKSSKIRSLAGNILAGILAKDAEAFNYLPKRDDQVEKGVTRYRKLVMTIVDNCTESSALSRKSHLHLLGQIVLSDPTILDHAVEDIFKRAAQDPAKSVREANMDACDTLLEIADIKDSVLPLWIQCVFRLYMDSETSVRGKAADLFESRILQVITLPISDTTDPDQRRSVRIAWNLLERITKDHLGDMRLFRQLCRDLEKNKVSDQKDSGRGSRLTKSQFDAIKAHCEGEFANTAWPVLAELALIIKGVKTDFALKALENGAVLADDTTASCVFKIVRARFSSVKHVPDTEVDFVQNKIFPTVKGISSVVECVRAIAAAYETNKEQDKFDSWCKQRILENAQMLSGLLKRSQSRNGTAAGLSTYENCDEIVFCVRLLGELGCFFKKWKKEYPLDTKDEKKKRAGTKWEIKNNNVLQLIVDACDFDGSAKHPSAIRAHAVFALGRWCLSCRRLAWVFSEPIVALANSLDLDGGLRRNAVSVVFDLMKMCGDVMEAKLGRIYGWLADRIAEIRGDVINHLHNLLLNEHLQWDPAVFFQFLTAISDPNPVIREWVRSSLRCLMKKRNQCYTEFVESIVFLNGCTYHPRFKAAKQAGHQETRFLLSGTHNVEKRMEIYSFMLLQMNDEQKRQTYVRMLEQIFTPVVTGEMGIHSEEKPEFRNALADAIRILGLNEMKFAALGKGGEDDDEGEDGEANQDPEQFEDEARKIIDRETKAKRKELWERFQREVVSRSLLPAMGSLFKKSMDVGGNLRELILRLVNKLITEAEIDLSALASSTAGAEGRIFQRMYVEIRGLEQQDKAKQLPRTPTPAQAPADNSDAIPDVRESPHVDTKDLISLPKHTPATAPKLSPTSSNVNTDARSVADSAGPSKRRKLDSTAQNGNVTKSAAPPAADSEGNRQADARAPTEEPTGDSDDTVENVEVNPRVTRASSRQVSRKREAPTSTPKRSRRPRLRSPVSSIVSEIPVLSSNRKGRKKKPSEEMEEDPNDTLKPLAPPTKKRTAKGLAARAISTPNKTRMGDADMTFGLADISSIDPNSTQMTEASNAPTVRRSTRKK